MPTLTAIIPATNRPDTLARCRAAVEAASEAPEEVIVVADPPLAGPAVSRNRGAQRATGDVLVFVDADVEVHPDAFTRIREAFVTDPGLTALFGSYDDAPAAPGVVSAFRNLLHHDVHHASPGAATTFWAGLGAMRREAFLGAGGFDAERYAAPSIEDVELGMRLTARGGRIELRPEIQGTHLKRWTLWSMVRTDFAARGVPWVGLILDSGGSRALNLSHRHRLSALASLALAGGVVLRRPRAAAPAAPARRRRGGARAGGPQPPLLRAARPPSRAGGGGRRRRAARAAPPRRRGRGAGRGRAVGTAGLMRVHCFSTGVVREKRGTRGVRRYLPGGWRGTTLPVNVVAVEHPDGVCVFDTGQTARAARRGYFPRWYPFFRLARFELSPDDEAGAQLRRRGVDPSSVRWVVLSHLHTDHAGGLAAFPRATLVAGAAEWRRARGLAGRLRGYLPLEWPSGGPVLLAGPRTAAQRAFAWSHDLAGDGTLTVVPTPGHTPGHVALVVRDGERTLLLTGDAARTPEIEAWRERERASIIATHDPQGCARA